MLSSYGIVKLPDLPRSSKRAHFSQPKATMKSFTYFHIEGGGLTREENKLTKAWKTRKSLGTLGLKKFGPVKFWSEKFGPKI